jgi:hypothetical protein
MRLNALIALGALRRGIASNSGEHTSSCSESGKMLKNRFITVEETLRKSDSDIPKPLQRWESIR